jgi:hypothetical protein
MAVAIYRGSVGSGASYESGVAPGVTLTSEKQAEISADCAKSSTDDSGSSGSNDSTNDSSSDFGTSGNTSGQTLTADEFDCEFLKEHNKMRMDPMSFIPDLERMIEEYGDNMWRLVEVHG